MDLFYTDTTGIDSSRGRVLDPSISWAQEGTFLMALALLCIAFFMLENFLHHFAGVLVEQERAVHQLLEDNQLLRRVRVLGTTR